MSPREFVPAIPPVGRGVERPLWSVMIPTWNCAGYLRDTLASVLDQDPGPDVMQIEVVDDASTEDEPEAVVREVAGERVRFHRQPRNVGHVENFNTCLLRSRGRLVHLLHGDDLVLPGFYDAMGRAFDEAPAIGAAFCRDRRIDPEGRTLSHGSPSRAPRGVVDGWLGIIAQGQRLQPPAVVVRRAVYERLGGFDQRISGYGEDWEMWVRIASRYPVWYEPDALAAYRLHHRSLTERGVRTGRNADDYRTVIRLNRSHLPAEHVDAWTRTATVGFARACMRRGWRAVGNAEPSAALAHFREGLRTDRSGPVLREFTASGVRAVAEAVKGLARRVGRGLPRRREERA